MSKITTVIFDMYETLAVNNTGLWIETFRGICRVQGIEVDPEHLYREWKELDLKFRRERLNLNEPEKSPPFKSYEEAWRECFEGAFSRLGISGDPDAAAKDTIRDMGCREPYEDAVAALPAIQALWKTAVLSNADDAYLYPLLERIGWKFEAVLSSEEARGYKPLSSPFRRIMGELGVNAEETVYVGDTLYDDILGAKMVGIRAAWINRHGAAHDPQFPLPDYEIQSLEQLPGIIGAVS